MTYKCTYEIKTTAHADRGRARTTHVEARTARCWACSSFSRAVVLRLLSQQIVRLRFGSSSCYPALSPPPVSGLHYMIAAASTVISHQRHHEIGSTFFRRDARPDRLVWIVPEGAVQGCLHAYSGSALIGRSEPITVTQNMRKTLLVKNVGTHGTMCVNLKKLRVLHLYKKWVQHVKTRKGV